LKDTQGRPLWEPSLQVGVPSTLLGYSVKINNFMATMAANAKSIAFGDFNAGYVVREVNGGGLLRLEERYAELLQVGFIGFGRYDGLVQDSSAIKLYVNSAT
jgi:HK97 family phage major capsid protein